MILKSFDGLSRLSASPYSGRRKRSLNNPQPQRMMIYAPILESLKVFKWESMKESSNNKQLDNGIQKKKKTPYQRKTFYTPINHVLDLNCKYEYSKEEGQDNESNDQECLLNQNSNEIDPNLQKNPSYEQDESEQISTNLHFSNIPTLTPPFSSTFNSPVKSANQSTFHNTSVNDNQQIPFYVKNKQKEENFPSLVSKNQLTNNYEKQDRSHAVQYSNENERFPITQKSSFSNPQQSQQRVILQKFREKKVSVSNKNEERLNEFVNQDEYTQFKKQDVQYQQIQQNQFKAYLQNHNTQSEGIQSNREQFIGDKSIQDASFPGSKSKRKSLQISGDMENEKRKQLTGMNFYTNINDSDRTRFSSPTDAQNNFLSFSFDTNNIERNTRWNDQSVAHICSPHFAVNDKTQSFGYDVQQTSGIQLMKLANNKNLSKKRSCTNSKLIENLPINGDASDQQIEKVSKIINIVERQQKQFSLHSYLQQSQQAHEQTVYDQLNSKVNPLNILQLHQLSGSKSKQSTEPSRNASENQKRQNTADESKNRRFIQFNNLNATEGIKLTALDKNNQVKIKRKSGVVLDCSRLNEDQKGGSSSDYQKITTQIIPFTEKTFNKNKDFSNKNLNSQQCVLNDYE